MKQATESQAVFKNKVHVFFKERHIGEILELQRATLNRHYIKFKPYSDTWFQKFTDNIDVDSVNFEKK